VVCDLAGHPARSGQPPDLDVPGGSTDGGATWTNDLISTASFDARKSFFSCGCFIGDYNQISVSDELVLPVWTDGRDSPPKPAGDSNVWTNVEMRT
jgi:hypothetical protein